jgi:hypothetical protein
MNPIFILLPAILVPIALYFLLRKPMRGGSGGDRADYKEDRPELTGTEQRKRRRDL